MRDRSRSFSVASSGRAGSGGLDTEDRERLRALGFTLSGSSEDESGADESIVSDLAERSSFTREQVRDMSERAREQLAETLDELAASRVTANVGVLASTDERGRTSSGRAGVANTDGLDGVGALASLSAREAARERQEGSDGGQGIEAYTASVGALATLSERESVGRR